MVSRCVPHSVIGLSLSRSARMFNEIINHNRHVFAAFSIISLSCLLFTHSLNASMNILLNFNHGHVDLTTEFSFSPAPHAMQFEFKLNDEKQYI